MSPFCGPKRRRQLLKMRIRKHAGHAVAAAIDAVQHDVAARRTAGLDPRYRGLIRGIAVVEIGDAGILRVGSTARTTGQGRLRVDFRRGIVAGMRFQRIQETSHLRGNELACREQCVHA